MKAERGEGEDKKLNRKRKRPKGPNPLSCKKKKSDGAEIKKKKKKKKVISDNGGASQSVETVAAEAT